MSQAAEKTRPRDPAPRRAWPWIWCFLSAIWVLSRPWGNYPLNDDWTYAAIAKTFAETGSLSTSKVYASSIAQAAISAPFVLAFGFSHTLLRLLSMVMACLAIWGLDTLLRCVEASFRVRLLSLAVVAGNPLFVYFSTSFMTESFGYPLAVVVAALWFLERRRAVRGEDSDSGDEVGPRLRTSVACGLGALSGAAFLVRPYCGLVLPALIFSVVLPLVVKKQWRTLWRSIVPLGAALAVLASVAGAYVWWAYATGNASPALSGFGQSFFQLSLARLPMHLGLLLPYLTAFFLPVLLLFPWPSGSRLAVALVAVSIMALLAFGKSQLPGENQYTSRLVAEYKTDFPYLKNIIYNAGLGPITLTDAYLKEGAPRPQWGRTTWHRIEAILLAATLLWSGILVAAGRTTWKPRPRLPSEAQWFALTWAILSFIITVQVHKRVLFDRYHYPVVFGMAVLLAVSLSQEKEALRFRLVRVAASALAAALVLFFSVGGLHDQFRWNDARWQLVDKAQAMGAEPENLQGGYEVNGWLLQPPRPLTPKSCVGRCGCDGTWGCVDDSFLITMSPWPGYRVVASLQPDYWLAKGPPLLLSQRTFSR